MVNAGDVLLYSMVGTVAAYITNFMGFKTWADQYIQAQPPLPPPPPLPPVEPQPEPKPAPFSAGKSGNCTWDTKGGWCWDSTACGGRCKTCTTVKTTNVADGCGRARSNFINNASKCPACKKTTTTTTTTPTAKCPYSGCTSLSPGSGCYQCRCSGICKSHPNTHAVTKADGSCTCVENAPSLASCQKYCSVGGGTAKIVNGNCQCYAPSYYCPYSGCANEKTRTSCFMCRCRGICRSHPGTYPSVKADGTCTCPRTASVARVRARAYPSEELDAGLMQVPTIA